MTASSKTQQAIGAILIAIGFSLLNVATARQATSEEGVNTWGPWAFAPAPEILLGTARAMDGYTIELYNARTKRTKTIRLYGINAPEVDSSKSDEAVAALRGQIFLNQLVGENQVDCLILDIGLQRLIGRCRTGGKDLAEAIVRAGWAVPDADQFRDALEYENSEYQKAYRAAHSEGVGIHGK